MYRKAIATSTSIMLIMFTVTASMPFATAIVTWTEENRLTTWPYFDGVPSVTQTRDGKIWVVWQQDLLGNYSIVYKTSNDSGSSWSDTKILVYDPGDTAALDQSPSILGAANGTIWVVWSSDRPPPPPPPSGDFTIDADPKNLTIQKGDNDTSTIIITSLNNFNDPVDLMILLTPENVTTSLDPQQVTPPPNGTATSTLTVSVETTATPGNYTLLMIGKSGQLSHTVNIGLEIIETGTLSRSSSSLTPHSATGGVYNLFYKTSHDYGASWSNVIQLTAYGGDDLSPSIFEASNGTIWVVWHSYREGSYEIFYKTYDGSWSNDKRLTTDPHADKLARITQTDDNRIWVVWSSDRHDDNEIFYKTYGGSWSNDTRLTTHSNGDTDPSMIQLKNGTLLIIWTSIGTKPTDTSDLYYKRSVNNGLNWSESIQFTTDGYDDMWSSSFETASVTFGSPRETWIVWTSNRADQPYGNYDIWFRKTIALAGDVNDDGLVDVEDLVIVALAWGANPGKPYWKQIADLNEDNFVDIVDLVTVGSNFGRKS